MISLRMMSFIILSIGFALIFMGSHGSGCNCEYTTKQPVRSDSWWDVEYDAVGRIGDHILARCYDAGGYASGSFIILIGDYQSVDLGERCDAYVSFTFIEGKGASSIPIQDGCGSSVSISQVPSGFPTSGTVLLRVQESILLVPPNAKVRATISGYQAPTNPTYHIYKIRNITPGWDELKIRQVLE